MRQLLVILCILLAAANLRGADWLPVREVNNNRINLSVNGGWHIRSHVALMGFGATVYGVHITIGGVGNCKMAPEEVVKGRTTASAMIQFGYQIPIVRAFRVIPVVGTAATGKVVFDMTDAHLRSADDDPKTRLKMQYHFDAGVHLVYNHRKLIVNAAVTRYTLFAGVGIEF